MSETLPQWIKDQIKEQKKKRGECADEAVANGAVDVGFVTKMLSLATDVANSRDGKACERLRQQLVQLLVCGEAMLQPDQRACGTNDLGLLHFYPQPNL